MEMVENPGLTSLTWSMVPWLQIVMAGNFISDIGLPVVLTEVNT